MLDNANISNSVSFGLAKLETWIEKNGWAGYDPYDLRETDAFQRLLKWPFGKYTTYIVERFFPTLARKMLRIRPQINAKAMGLLALGYMTRFRATGESIYRDKALSCLRWLAANICPNYSGACWGYPFNWHSRIFIPKGTPSSVVSTTCGLAFLEAYRLFGETSYLDIARSIADFLVNDLNIDHVANDRICFSYTPLDQFHVHNANLFVAAHLAEVSAFTGATPYRELAVKATTYTVNEQQPEGAWHYWGSPDSISPQIDHYHTGFVLRSLNRICQVIDNADWRSSLERGFNYYKNNLFDASGLPKLTPSSNYPVDIHGCAEALLCLSHLSHLFPSAVRGLKTARWILDNMQSSEGYFYYRKYRLTTTRIPYLRWGQAWMLWGLGSYGLTLREESNR